MNPSVQHIHFIGIGGAGMCGIAELLLALGYRISGSDLSETPVTRHLRSLGIDVFVSHSPSHLGKSVQLVVRSSAVPDNNVEIIEAQNRRIPVIPRAQVLADLMRLKKGIAVAGTHGKTTTTSLIASIMDQASYDPTFVIGGKFGRFEQGASLGKGDYIVVEADESDKTFLLFAPTINIVTNIDRDHMGCYQDSISELKQAFHQFIENIPFYGVSFLCNEDETLREIFPHLSKRFIKYGFGPDSDIRAINCHVSNEGSSFDVIQEGFRCLSVIMPLVGHHNILNALSAIGVCRHLGVSEEDILFAICAFGGVARRFQRYDYFELMGRSCSMVDDYGHHPHEIAVTLESARQVFQNRRIILIFEPHRYTRTHDLFDDFVNVLQKADQLIVLPIYAASEKPIDGCTTEHLVQAITDQGYKSAYSVPGFSGVLSLLSTSLEDNDVILLMGAGSISELSQQLLKLKD